MKKEIVICHKEREYACRLANYLNQRSDENYLAMAATQPKEVFEMVRTRTIDLLLLDEEYVDQKAEFGTFIEQCCLLVKRETKDREEIMMYVAADEIYHKVKKRLFQKENKVDMEQFGIEAVFALGQEESNSGLELASEKNYLYWDWNPFSQPFEESRSEELIYDIKRRREDIVACLEDYIGRRNGYDIIPAPRYFMDMRSVTAEDLEWVAGKVRELGYAGMLWNMSFVSIGNIALLKAFSRIYVKADEEWATSYRYEQFMQYLDYVNRPREIVEVLDYEVD